MKRLAWALVALLLTGIPAWAASPVAVCGLSGTAGQSQCIIPNADGSIDVNGTFSASFTGFTPTGAASLAVTGSTGRVALPNADTTVILQNTGTTNLFFKLGTVAVTAATTDYSLPSGYSMAVQITTETHVAAITASSTTTLKVIQGTGIPTISGGGGVGSGGGGAVTVADGADVTQGALADAAWASGSGSVVAILKGIAGFVDGLETLTGALTETAPATDTASSGLNGRLQRIAQRLTTIIAGIPVTNAGVFAVQVSSALPAGSAIIGNVRIDQTTPGTTNGVQLPASQVVTVGTAGSSSTDVLSVQGIASGTKLDVNAAQINGVTPLMGTGNTGTGSPRVTIATDQAALAGMGVGATGAAVPANGNYVAGNGSGATGGLMVGLRTCDLHAKYDASDNGNITLVTGVSGRKVYICGYILANGGTATNLSLTEGSDANCATNNAGLTPVYQVLGNQSVGMMSPFWTGLVVSTNAYYVCIKSSAGNAHQGELWYTIQ